MTKVLIGLAVIVLFLGMGYLLMQNQMLQTSIAELKNPTRMAQNSFPTSTPTPIPTVVDSRELLLPNEYGIYFSIDKWGEGCNGSKAGNINRDPANAEIIFKSDKFGFSASLPYNKNWFSDMYRLNPYDVSPDGVFYGNLVGGEGCGLSREKGILVTSQKSVDQLLNELNKKKGEDFTWTSGPDIKMINGHQVVEWSSGGLCDMKQAEVVGKKNNYQLSDKCSGNLDEETIAKMTIY